MVVALVVMLLLSVVVFYPSIRYGSMLICIYVYLSIYTYLYTGVGGAQFLDWFRFLVPHKSSIILLKFGKYLIKVIVLILLNNVFYLFVKKNAKMLNNVFYFFCKELNKNV